LDITRERTIIDFEAPQVDAEIAEVLKEQFVLEYDPSSVTDLLPKCSSGIILWRVIWEHKSKEPPSDFAIRGSLRN
jgi:hypothetical protein